MKMNLREINSPSKAIFQARRESNFSMNNFKDFKRKASIRSPIPDSKKFIEGKTDKEASGFRSPQILKSKEKESHQLHTIYDNDLKLNIDVPNLKYYKKGFIGGRIKRKGK